MTMTRFSKLTVDPSGKRKYLEDNRTDEQMATHTIVIGGYDSWLSGWGKASGGDSYCGWACRPENADTVFEWVKKRGDISRVTRKLSTTRNFRLPRLCVHYRIYCVTENHLALGKPAAQESTPSNQKSI